MLRARPKCCPFASLALARRLGPALHLLSASQHEPSSFASLASSITRLVSTSQFRCSLVWFVAHFLTERDRPPCCLFGLSTVFSFLMSAQHVDSRFRCVLGMRISIVALPVLHVYDTRSADSCQRCRTRQLLITIRYRCDVVSLCRARFGL